MSRSRFLACLVFGVGVLAACGAEGGASSTTILATTTTTSSPATTTTIPEASTTTSSLPTMSGETLIVVGDWGTGTAPEGAVAGAIQRFADQHDLAGILTTGDNLLSDDAEFIMHPYGWVEEENLEWWITWGNHDVETDARIDLVNQTFDDPPRWTTLRWGETNVVILDSTQIDSQDQLQFLETALAASEDPTIVVFHHPAVSCLSPEEASAQEALVSLFDDDVLLALHGHEHNYQRFEVNGVTYVITGGGGSPLTPVTECPSDGPERVADQELHHFLAITQDAGTLRLQAIDINGAVLDEVSLPLG